MNTTSDKILVLGLGNTLLTDEAVGVRVLEYLKAHPDSRQYNLNLLDGGTMGLSLLVDMEDADAMIIVDAAMLDKKPGAVQVFENTEMDNFLRHRGRSPHDIGLDDILDGLRLREKVPEQRALVGVQPQILTIGEQLSDDVAAAVPVAAEAIFNILKRWKTGPISAAI